MILLPTKILVPLDGSENSGRACEYAIELCTKLGASIVFLNVLEIPIMAYKYHRVAENLLEVLEESGRSILSKSEAAARARKVACETVLAHGDPASQILATSRKKKCDLVIMGKRGMGRIERLLLGSVSDQVSKLSDMPVLVIK